MSEQSNAELIAELEQKIRKLEAKTDHIQDRPIQPTKEEWAEKLKADKERQREETRKAHDAARLQVKRERKAELDELLPRLQAEHADLIEYLKGKEIQPGVDVETLRNAGLLRPKLQ